MSLVVRTCLIAFPQIMLLSTPAIALPAEVGRVADVFENAIAYQNAKPVTDAAPETIVIPEVVAIAPIVSPTADQAAAIVAEVVSDIVERGAPVLADATLEDVAPAIVTEVATSPIVEVLVADASSARPRARVGLLPDALSEQDYVAAAFDFQADTYFLPDPPVVEVKNVNPVEGETVTLAAAEFVAETEEVLADEAVEVAEVAQEIATEAEDVVVAEVEQELEAEAADYVVADVEQEITAEAEDVAVAEVEQEIVAEAEDVVVAEVEQEIVVEAEDVVVAEVEQEIVVEAEDAAVAEVEQEIAPEAADVVAAEVEQELEAEATDYVVAEVEQETAAETVDVAKAEIDEAIEAEELALAEGEAAVEAEGDLLTEMADANPNLSIREGEDGQEDTMVMLSDVLFQFGKADLAPEAVQTLAAIASTLEEVNQLTVTGHTDSIGSEENNIVLAQARAEAVRDWLLQNSELTSDVVLARGVGEADPIAPNETDTGQDNPEGRAQNRRVEFAIN